MNTVREITNGVEIIIETADRVAAGRDRLVQGRRTKPSGISAEQSALGGAYSQLRSTIRQVASDFAADLQAITPTRPDDVQLEFALAFSTNVNGWIFTAGGGGTFRVTMTWRSNGPS